MPALGAPVGAPAMVYQTLGWGGALAALLAWARGVNRRVEHEREVER